jgi:GNAT superfamily N-acetyltransferase
LLIDWSQCDSSKDLDQEMGTKNVSGIVIRKATEADSTAVVELIVGLANFEHLEPPDSKAKVRLVKDIFDRKLAEVLVATSGEMFVGYALFFYTYSSFLARPTLYLEDIFVRDDSRRLGIGKALFMRCVKEAARNGCGRVEWQVLTWNKKAMKFYEKLGAKRIEDYRLFRLDREKMRRLTNHAVS